MSQTTTRIGAHFATAPALTSVAVNDIDFGTWVVNIAGEDTPSIALKAGKSGAPEVPSPNGVSNPGTIIRNTIAPKHAGEVLIHSPITGSLQIKASVLSDFSDPSLSLTNLVYTDSSVSDIPIPQNFDGATFVTINDNTETIWIGGTLKMGLSGKAPNPDTTFNDAVIELSFSY